jgi:NAD(P)-dependent dehydrogenase (short-subunit alcohol dehydrogenase family)
MSNEFEGKVVLITGATSGIGRDAALLFAENGATVIASGRRVEEGEGLVETLNQKGGNAVFIAADVSKPNEVASLFNRIRHDYGQLNFAFNNAGWEGPVAPITSYDVATFDLLFATNVRGQWLCLKEELPMMETQGGGAIVNMSSMVANLGFPGASLYCATKHAILGITKSAALEYASKGIRINAVCPGAIQTPLLDRAFDAIPGAKDAMMARHPIGRLGRSEEIAPAVLWLCSKAASFVTGTEIYIDGGYSAI